MPNYLPSWLRHLFTAYPKRLTGLAIACAAVLITSAITYTFGVPFTTISKGIYLGQRDGGDYVNQPQLKDPSAVLLTSQRDIDYLLTRLAYSSDDITADSSIGQIVAQLRRRDWAHSYAVIVFQGYRGSTGSSITINQVLRIGSHVLVAANADEPGWWQGGGAMVTDPYHLIVVPVTSDLGPPSDVAVWSGWRVVTASARPVP